MCVEFGQSTGFTNNYNLMGKMIPWNREEGMDCAWLDHIRAHSYNFTASRDECFIFLTCGRHRLCHLDVAKLIAHMCTFDEGNQQLDESVGHHTFLSPDGTRFKTSDGGYSGTLRLVPQKWQPDIFVAAVSFVVGDLDWATVFKALDFSNFKLRDRNGLVLLLQIFCIANNTMEFPYNDMLYTPWHNPCAQLALLKTALRNTDVLCFYEHPRKEGKGNTQCEMAVPYCKTNKMISNWHSLDLVERLLYLAEFSMSCQLDVREIFEQPLRDCPPLFLATLCELPPPVSSLRKELFKRIVRMLVQKNDPNCFTALEFALTTSHKGLIHEMILEAICEWYQSSEIWVPRLERIFQLVDELKIWDGLLNTENYQLFLDVICLGSGYKPLEIESWLHKCLHSIGAPFVKAMLEYLYCCCPQLFPRAVSEEKQPLPEQCLPLETVAILVISLQQGINYISPELVQRVLNVKINLLSVLAQNRGGELLENKMSKIAVKEPCAASYQKVYFAVPPYSQTGLEVKRLEPTVWYAGVVKWMRQSAAVTVYFLSLILPLNVL